LRFEASCCRNTVEFRHINVHQDNRRPKFFGAVNRILSVCRFSNNF
jgi:hypothetical protein